ncbi:helix-turn-helix domain-containing protein [Flavobacterium pallidum]|uniref:AraC family transcriptional regulator n=1 Tax=Flavobacterium pallidum TaxID=2172098 RepID=A0A2S1SLH9_9FLAO|nr:AraC family transcriptional regulator [Flavobacterium pallidum]AWI27240.1 AraC family transcriptional regulator [Flavobacterium pallidum]
METTVTLEDFYHNTLSMPEQHRKGFGHFNVFRSEDCFSDGRMIVRYSRREFYKISLIRGNYRYHYADKSFDVSGSTLIFHNPHVPYTWELLSGEISGHFCIFTESFFTERFKGNPADIPMFSPSGKPAYALSEEEDAEVTAIFLKMKSEIDSEYAFKYDLLSTYMMELVHFALKRQPTETIYKHPDANSRITSVFMELLERQFPIESISQRFSLRSAKDFAGQLSIHVNHLNRAVKNTTGKTTTNLIAERLANEAKALLKHTNWNISEIGYTLGFDEASHFNNFFRKQTTLTPSSFRNV